VAEPLQHVDGHADRGLDLGIHPLGEVLVRHAQPQATHALLEAGGVIGHGRVDRRRVHRVVAGDGAEQPRRVGDVQPERSGVIERRGEGDEAVARDAPVRRLQPDHAAERRRLADRASGVGPEPARREARGDGGRGAA